MFVDGEYFDCLILLNGQQIDLGEWHTLAVTFLRPDLVMPLLAVCKPIMLWESGFVADGTIRELLIA